MHYIANCYFDWIQIYNTIYIIHVIKDIALYLYVVNCPSVMSSIAQTLHRMIYQVRHHIYIKYRGSRFDIHKGTLYTYIQAVQLPQVPQPNNNNPICIAAQENQQCFSYCSHALIINTYPKVFNIFLNI